MTTNVHIVAIGARTPLGFQVAPGAAAVRAGISAVQEHPFMTDAVGDPIPGAFDHELDPCIFGSARLLGLAETAVREACALLAPKLASTLRLPLFLGLPEFRPGFTAKDASAVRSGIAQLMDESIGVSEVEVFPQGHAAGFVALTEAVRQIERGRIEVCLVGGVESYFHPFTMHWLDANRQVVGTVSRSGFVPGEGAGFCVVASRRALDRMGLRSLVRVAATAVGRETKVIKTDAVCLGEGLTRTVEDVLGQLGPNTGTINSIICDINGERYRGEEWGFVCLRLSRYFDDPTDYLSPAEYWGDMGAASAPLFTMLACQAAERGCSEGPRTLVWASSEGGLRGAAVLETTSAD